MADHPSRNLACVACGQKLRHIDYRRRWPNGEPIHHLSKCWEDYEQGKRALPGIIEGAPPETADLDQQLDFLETKRTRP